MNTVERIDARVAGIKIPPHSVEAEQAVLGSCLLHADALYDVREVIQPTDFHRMDHRAIFAALCEIQDAGDRPDPLTVSERCGKHSWSDPAYLMELVESAPGVSNAAAYARIVLEKSQRRAIIEAAHRMSDVGFDSNPDWIARAQAEASAIEDDRSQAHIVTGKEAAREWLELLESRTIRKERGLSVGFRDLDWRWGGLRAGNLVVIAGRPGSGKTTLAMNIAENVSAEHGVLVFSLEMSTDELMDRSVARLGKVDLRRLRSGDLSQEHYAAITGGVSQIAGSHLLIDDTPRLHITEIRARARARHRREPLSLIVIDYLQLARGDGERQDLRVAHITSECKAIAKELACPVILLSQLNRDCEKRGNKRPMLSDLRDSGSIEQDADYVAFTYRDEMYSETSPFRGVMEVNTAKMRMGQPGANYLRANLARSTLEDVNPDYQPPKRNQHNHGDPDL